MSSCTLPQPRFRTVTVRVPAAPHDAAWIQGWAMKFLGWTTTIFVVGALIAFSAAADVLLPRVICSLLLAAIGLIAGLRIATRSTSAYIEDLQRVNKVLFDQQRDLEEVNAILLKQINSEVESAAPSERT